MTAYGNFEATREVFKSHHGAIWAARTAGTQESADCCVKVMQLDDGMIAAHDSSLAQNLLISSALQQAMGNKSEYWAPVYGLGSEGTNAYYVGRLFPRSVQTLIDNKVDLTSAELKIILLSVADGLLDLESAFHRSHGNLKPSNVLLSDKSKIQAGTVFLTDPDSSSEAVPSLTKSPDSKAIGELLYALVTQKPHSTARWPLPASDKWKQLGSSGRQWFMLCESLLNTVARRGLPSMEQVRERIDAVTPTRRRLPRAVVALLLLAAIGAGAYAERDQLPGLYHQASDKVIAFVHSRLPASGSGHREVLTANHPSASALSTTEPTVVIGEPATLIQPAKSVIAPAPPPPAVPSPPTVVDDDGVKEVRQTPSPEFHSTAARAEFTTKRDRFAAAHSDATSAFTLGEWGQVLSKIQGIDGDYPPLDGGATAGWPAGLPGVMNARRDSALIRAIDEAFNKRHADPSSFQATLQRVQQAATAVVIAHDAFSRGDLAVSQKSIVQCNAAINSFPSTDDALVPLFAPAMKEFKALAEIDTSSDRPALLEVADNESASLAVRLAAWYRVGPVSMESWPTEFIEMAADDARADRLHTLLVEAGTITAADQVAITETSRRDGFFTRLRDQSSVAAAVKQSADAQYGDIVKKSPIWFQYDAALYTLKTTLPTQVTADQKKHFADLATQVDAPGLQLVRDSLDLVKSPPTLPQSGPGSIKGWQLRPGWTRDHCTFVASSSGSSLEFLRVHVPDDADCYLCTTEAPVALMQAILNGNHAAISTAETLNEYTGAATAGMHVWSFNDRTNTVDVDESNYRKCFVIGPSDQLPAQAVTPQTAFYLARQVGCRFPTGKEWSAAFNQAKTSADAKMKGFALTGWKLRDRQFASLLTSPNRDAGYWPDDNIFTGDLDPAKLPRGKDAEIWSAGDLSQLGGRTTTIDVNPMLPWPLSALEASSGFGFRSVGDGENYSGVFHDLIGNVSEYVMDEPVILSERVAVSPALSSDDAVHVIKDWFSSERLAAVSVIGGSALSPPGLDPTKPYPLPATVNPPLFSDVGFRLAFTDPAGIPRAQQALLGKADYVVAPAAAH